jgi:hypothetical protein
MSKFTPMVLQAPPALDSTPHKMTLSCTIKGKAAAEFEKILQETGLNKSQLMVQMIYHCLNRTEELKDLYRRLAILGE